MKHNLLQKLAIALMLCFFFQNAQAQIDDGKFPDKLRPPMIDNIVIFNSSLVGYIVTIQSTNYSVANITDESNNANSNQNTNTPTVENEAVVTYSSTSKDVAVNKIEDKEMGLNVGAAAEVAGENTTTQQHTTLNSQQNYSFNFTRLADLVEAYPNPVQHTLTVEMRDNLSLDIRLINMMGQVVYAQSLAGMDKVQINVMDFAKGTYILDIRSNTERVSQKIQIVR